jgi:hypothetical protein
MNKSEEHILQMLNEGKITAEEADKLLQAVEKSATADADTIPPDPMEESGLPHVQQYRDSWRGPFLGSVFALALAGSKIISSRSKKGFFTRVRLSLYWGMLTLGTIGALFALWSRNARWLRIHVENEDNRIDLSLPVPIHLLSWLLNTLRPYVDQETGRQFEMAAEFIQAMQQEMDSPDGKPLVIDINDEGSRVQVYLI